MICTLGDLLLDVIVRLDAPIAADTDTYGRTKVGAGGQAPNVAAWTVALGGRARFIGKRGADTAGRLAAEELRARGVEVCGPEVEGATGTVVSVTTPDGRRAMLTDRGVAPDLRADELDARWLDDCERLHLTGYSLVRSPISEAAIEAARRATERGIPLSVDLSATTAIGEIGPERFARILDDLAPEIVFANEDEARLVPDVRAPVVVVKRGGDGCSVRRDGDETSFPAERADLLDATGAGDAFAAGFLLGGPTLALAAAAQCVSQMGAMP